MDQIRYCTFCQALRFKFNYCTHLQNQDDENWIRERRRGGLLMSIQKLYWAVSVWNDNFEFDQYFAENIDGLKKQFDAEIKEWTNGVLEKNPGYEPTDTFWEFVMAENKPQNYDKFSAAYIQCHTTKHVEVSNS